MPDCGVLLIVCTHGSPARNRLHDANLQTPSSPEYVVPYVATVFDLLHSRQESLPRTPAHPHAAWEVAHVASSPMDLPSTREARIGQFTADDMHTFIGHGRKAPPIVAPPPPPRSDLDDDDMLPTTAAPARETRSPRAPPPGLGTSSPSAQPRPLADASSSQAGPSRKAGDVTARDLPQTPRMRRIAPVGDDGRAPPDYLKRAKRARDSADTAAAEHEEREQTLPGLGIHVSPNNGRRLKLYQPPTPDARAPPRASLDGPSTPSRTFNAMSSRARAWLESSSPSRPRTRPGLSEQKAGKEGKKRKRLAAFEQDVPATCPLDIYEVEGRGRILVSSSAAKTHLIVSNPDASVAPSTPPRAPDWPDEQYPWSSARSVRDTQKDDEEAERLGKERLRWVERFLDRDSDEENSADEASSRASGSLQGSPLRGKGSPKSPGKQKRRAGMSEPVADARAALFSRREVRKLTEMHHSDPEEEDDQSASGSEQNADEEEEDGDDGIVRCICGGDEDDRPMVACDRCSIWFHQVCMGIKNQTDLEDQEKWYCFECRRSRTRTPPPPPPQPVFSVSSPDTHIRPSLDKPLFQATPLQSSPAFFGAFGSPSPSRPRERDERRPPSWFDSPHAPTTPFRRSDRDRDRDREARLLRTPGAFDPFSDESLPSMGLFDTPSRGLGFNVPFATPTQPPRRSSGGLNASRTPASGGMPVTPKPGARVHASEDSVISTSSPLERFARIVGEETPLATRRLPARPTSPTPAATQASRSQLPSSLHSASNQQDPL